MTLLRELKDFSGEVCVVVMELVDTGLDVSGRQDVLGKVRTPAFDSTPRRWKNVVKSLLVAVAPCLGDGW